MSFVVQTELQKVVYVKLHRPEVRNAFNSEMIAELTEIFRKLEKRRDLYAIVLLGEGKVFCAGADLTWMKAMVNYSFEENRQDAFRLFEMFEAMSALTLPLLGVVQGAVFGGGLGLISTCDYVIAEEGTQFCFSEVKLGIAPAVISSFILPKVNPGIIRPLMLSGRVFDPALAMAAGLVHEIVPAGEGHNAIQRVLHSFRECGVNAVRSHKALLRDLPRLSWSEQKERTANVISELRIGSEGQEGLRAFLEKRDPKWREV
ncbi:MAG: enoyl-CoA hydratase-related protein [Bdellovibrionaceae bacterium]|nr:enoyl-CoA hydratase-related protein [Pseudobdellovibrionaceae bacterium]